MWPDLVAVSAVSLQLFLRIRKGQEPVSVQTFSAELAVKAFDEGIVGWFPGPSEFQRDTFGIGPQVQIVGDELRALVNAKSLGIADLRASLFQSLYDVLLSIAESGVDDGREACERINNRQDPELAARC